MKKNHMTISILIFLFSSCLLAENKNYTQKSEVLLKQLQVDIKKTLLVVAQHEVQAGNNMSNFYFSVNLPPQQMTNIGLVLDITNAYKGYNVLSVTPGSTADKLNIKSGDKILAINNIKINKENHTEVIQQLNKMVAGQNIKLLFNSGGTVKEVSTNIIGQYIPNIKLEIGSTSAINPEDELTASPPDEASLECGKVSLFFLPPVNQDLYPATINKIDNDHRKRNWHSYRLPVGKHTIYLVENINDPTFPIRRVGRQKAKPIEIDIKVNTTYYLAAKFNRRHRLSTSNGKFWDPVVWKTSEKKCQL